MKCQRQCIRIQKAQGAEEYGVAKTLVSLALKIISNIQRNTNTQPAVVFQNAIAMPSWSFQPLVFPNAHPWITIPIYHIRLDHNQSQFVGDFLNQVLRYYSARQFEDRSECREAGLWLAPKLINAALKFWGAY